jgi:pilus assembly protein CpaC
LGKLFQSKSLTRSNSELLVIVTPEIVRPIASGQQVPEIPFPAPLLPPDNSAQTRQPGIDKTGPVPVAAPSGSIPIEQLIQAQKPVSVPLSGPPPIAPPPSGISGLEGHQQ